MKKNSLIILFLLIISAISYAQNVSQNQNGAYLIPRLIYVGDPAVLVLPLQNISLLPGESQSAKSHNGITELKPEDVNFPFDENIDFRRVILERHVKGGSRLMIEFTAFVPGVLELPPIEIGGERFAGLTVTVNSMIDSRSPRMLSGPASSLAMPGTAVLLYGSIAAVVFLILLSIWFVFKGRAFLKKLKEKWMMKRLFISMRKTEKRLHRAMLKGIDKRVILDKLSEGFRAFLSLFTAGNCRAMTAREFEKLPPDFFPAQEYGADFLSGFFKTCDTLRFSGADIEQAEILRLLGDLRRFLEETENAEKEKNKQEEEKAA
jgi:hypothetical protein